MTSTISVFNGMQFPENNEFTYIIGNNGSGKSRALEANAERICEKRKVVVIASGASDKFKFRSQVRQTPNGYYRYLGNRTVGNGTHNGTLVANAILFFIAAKNAGLDTDFKRFLETIDFDGKVGIRYRKTKFSKTKPFDTQELTSEFVASNQEILAAKERPFEAVFYKSGTPYPLSDLSSGEQYIIFTALKIVTSIEDGVCYFIDEPEVSLHVQWQIKWPEYFHPLLSLKSGVNCYVATHSPVIISSALKAGADCYNLSNGQLLKISEREFNVERILLREFNTLTPDNKYLFEELAAIVTRTVDHLSIEGPDDAEEGEASVEALESVEKLKEKLKHASRTEDDDEFIRRTMEDFDMAIRDLIAMGKHAEVQATPPEGGK
jgi:predicted ATPase